MASLFSFFYLPISYSVRKSAVLLTSLSLTFLLARIFYPVVWFVLSGDFPAIARLCLFVFYGIRCFIFLHIIQVMSGDMSLRLDLYRGLMSSLGMKSRGMIGFA
jgi:hypothetical protein